MSDIDLIEQQQSKQQESVRKPIIDFYESTLVNESDVQQKLRAFYSGLDYSLCGDYPQPNITAIRDRKKQLNLPFAQSHQVFDGNLEGKDGLFEHHEQTAMDSNLKRLKARMIRDIRVDYFQENGKLVVEEQFYQQQMSRLANISFEDNLSIKTFQKNAILSQRNNQKKNNPFQLELTIGCVNFHHHPQQNEEERKFQQVIPLMKDYSQYCRHPKIPEISRQLHYLETLREKLLQNKLNESQLQEIFDKITDLKKKYDKEKNKIEAKINKVLEIWTEIKNIRAKTGIQTVPYNFKVKEYQVNGRISYDFGVTQIELPEKVSAKSLADAQQQEARRLRIKSERYMLKVYINDSEVAKTDKLNLQWPSLRILFNNKFTIMVYSVPNSIRVEVLKVGFINTVVDNVSLSVPGNYAKTITSAERRFESSLFSMNGSKVRKGLQAIQPPSGYVIYKVQWKGQGQKMPPLSSIAKAAEQSTAATEDDVEDNKQLYDTNDPRQPHKLKRQLVDNQIVKDRVSLLPFAKIQSTRHFLLKLKSSNSQYQNMRIPLMEDEISRRDDLEQVMNKERNRNLENYNNNQTQFYNPLEGVFRTQNQPILNAIKNLLNQIQSLKKINRSQAPTLKYKVTEEVVKEFIFQNQISPIVIFFKNFFQQKRKLGPQTQLTIQPKGTLENFQINIHIRSAKNVPIREASFLKIRNFKEEQNRRNQVNKMMAGNLQMINQFGMGFWGRQPNMNTNMFMGRGMIPNRQQQVDYNQPNSLQRVDSYVELRFKKVLKKTHCFQGPYPEWNQTLMFNYDLKKQNMSLQKISQNGEKTISLLLFDIIEQSKQTYAIDELRVKKSKYFLGRIQIPFSTIVATPSVTGIFKVDRPLIIFSYGIKKAGLFDLEIDQQEANKSQFPDIHTFLSLDFFSQPLIDSAIIYSSDRKFMPGLEHPILLQRATDWLQELNTKRYIRMWLNNIKNKSIFICRFLSQQICPPKQLGEQKLIERCARFVSLIPKKFQCRILDNTDEFHLMCDEMLNIKMGEDHGILLCNYFNYIDKHKGRDHIESYLVIGKSFPYGKSIFVLRRDKKSNDCQIWDPFKGQCYFFPAKEYDTYCFCIKLQRKVEISQNAKDICPMFEIGCIVAKDNVFINCQQFVKPNQLDFNLQDEKLWKPFLNERTRNEVFESGIIQSFQTPIPYNYYPQLQNLQMTLENQLHEYIRNKIETQRRRQFNPYGFRINNNLSKQIRDKILLHCQTSKSDYRFSGINSSLYDPIQKNNWSKVIETFMKQKNQIKAEVDSDKNLYGFPINVTFTTKQEIWERIAETQLHLNEKQQIQFVLSIRCFELVCHVVSVWIFIGFVE